MSISETVGDRSVPTSVEQWARNAWWREPMRVALVMSSRAIMTEPTSPGARRTSPEKARSFTVAKTSIACGADFSEHAAQAVEVPAALARRLNELLVLAQAEDKDSRAALGNDFYQRHGLGRIGHHSVSRAVLKCAPMSVACISMGAGEEAAES